MFKNPFEKFADKLLGQDKKGQELKKYNIDLSSVLGEGIDQEELQHIESLFHKCWNDVYDISKSKCLQTDFSKQNGGATGGDVGAYEPEDLKDLRDYTNKYGGLSASGYNGAV